jgi:hypothetical protein
MKNVGNSRPELGTWRRVGASIWAMGLVAALVVECIGTGGGAEASVQCAGPLEDTLGHLYDLLLYFI